MGGLSCVAGKPEEEVEPLESKPGPGAAKVVRRESQRPWNRQSLVIYAGDPKPDTSQDKPPGNNEQSEPSDQNKAPETAVTDNDASVDKVTANGNVVVESDGKSAKTVQDSGKQSVKDENTHPGINGASLEDNESQDSVPDIATESAGARFNPPPHIAPFDPSERIIKRPRSLDSADNFVIARRSRPRSYSPALFKTKHPRSIHCITAAVDAVRTPPMPRYRPLSMDLTSFAEGRGIDIPSNKLKRLFTQKSPRKISREQNAAVSCTAVVPYQPGQTKYVEEGPSRCFQPSQMAKRKKENRELKTKEVHYLRKAVIRPRMKFSKSLDIFFHRSEQYLQYDPFLNEKAAQPSNPWVSEDETMWDINRNLVEVPTEIRIRKWALSFEELLHDETGRNEFEQFLKKEYSQENIRFYKACRQLIVCPQSHVSQWKADIEKEFLTPGAPCEVNVDAKTLEQVVQQLKADRDVSGKTRYIFQPAMEHVYTLMKKDSYTRFLRSDQYKQLLEQSQTHYTKKRFFNFGGSNRKKTPSPHVHRRRGSDGGMGDMDMGSGGYHSYSTGNLRELDEKPKANMRQSNSPSLRRRTDDSDHRTSKDPRRRSNLEVPRTSFTSVTDPARKSEALAPCIALTVPRTNIVTPWEGQS